MAGDVLTDTCHGKKARYGLVGQFRQSLFGRLGSHDDVNDAGLMGDVNLSVYCASKGGIVNLTRAPALELAPDVRVNCVCPSFIDTDMGRDEIEKADDPAAAEQTLIDYSPMKRFATPEEIGRASAYLASDDARCVTGAAFRLDGGTTAGH